MSAGQGYTGRHRHDDGPRADTTMMALSDALNALSLAALVAETSEAHRADELLGAAEMIGLGHRVQAADLEVAAEGRWQDRARCAETDPDAFFPEFGESTRQAEKVCAGCEVRAECLEYALENREMYGVWGGVPEHERHQLRLERAKEAAA